MAGRPWLPAKAGEDTLLVNNREAISSRVCRLVSGHWSLTEQLPHDLSSFYRAVPLGHGIELLCRPCAGAEERVTRYLGRGSFRCLINKRDVFSRQPFGFDQFAVFSIVPVIDPCLRHVDSPKNNRSTHLLWCTTERNKKSQPRPAGMAPSTDIERIGKASVLSRLKRGFERAQTRHLLHETISPCMLPGHVSFDLMNRAHLMVMAS